MPFHIPARPQAAVQVAAWDALPQWGHRLKQIQAHSGLLSGSEHIHKDTHVGEEPEYSANSNSHSVTSRAACALHEKADTQSQQLCSFCILQKNPMPQLSAQANACTCRHPAETMSHILQVKVMGATKGLLFT